MNVQNFNSFSWERSLARARNRSQDCIFNVSDIMNSSACLWLQIFLQIGSEVSFWYLFVGFYQNRPETGTSNQKPIIRVCLSRSTGKNPPLPIWTNFRSEQAVKIPTARSCPPCTYKCATTAGLAELGCNPPPSTDVVYAEKIRLSVGKGTTHLSSFIMVGLRWS